MGASWLLATRATCTWGIIAGFAALFLLAAAFVLSLLTRFPGSPAWAVPCRGVSRLVPPFSDPVDPIRSGSGGAQRGCSRFDDLPAVSCLPPSSLLSSSSRWPERRGGRAGRSRDLRGGAAETLVASLAFLAASLMAMPLSAMILGRGISDLSISTIE